ncbi:hypothetical protein LWI29_022960 [Acer saccharum]|uniref:DUF668 domain-containing protein n=1 Tax=Acer saccharum TaxID=4024 RepID=A0AA39S6I9_ACESA|nr:hypothetical protein LWI29_022960 [Acer saccharum]
MASVEGDNDCEYNSTGFLSRSSSFSASSQSSVYPSENNLCGPFGRSVSKSEEWKLALERILEWLAPLARNMIRWQSEHNFEKESVVSRTNVLLVQTFHFASQAKTEAAITELLVGLNYICRIGRDRYERLCQSSLAEETTMIIC